MSVDLAATRTGRSFVEDLNVRTLDDVERIEATPLEERVKHHTTYEAIAAVADSQPDHPAIFWLPTGAPSPTDRIITYGELIGGIRQMANLLRAHGIGRSDVVAYLLPSLPETHIVLAGTQAAAIVLPLNPLLDREHLAGMLKLAGAKLLVAARGGDFAAYEQKAREIAAAIPTLSLLFVDTAEQKPDGLAALLSDQPSDRLAFDYDARPSDYATYMHTGGTTGLPKIARSTHWAECSQGWLIAGLSGLNPYDRSIAALPLFHATAVRVNGIATWTGGASLVLLGPAGFRNPEAVGRLWETIEAYRVTSFVAVATVYAALLNIPLAGKDISSLTQAASGAAPLPVEIIERFEKSFGVAISEGYGLTEGCCMSARNPRNGTRKIGSIGFRIPYQPMKSVILDAEGNYVRDCAVDEVGILVLRGPNAIDSYLHGKTGLFVDGDWINTGDLARQDGDGYFYITGRAKDLIIRSGHNIDPQLIENVLQMHPDVDLVAAVGMPDTYAGELPVAFVTLKPGASIKGDRLKEYAFERITERPAAPKQVFILPAMPLTAVGKLSKLHLRCVAAEQAIRTAVADRLPKGVEISVEARPDERTGIFVDISLTHPPGYDQAAFEASATSLLRSFAFAHELRFVDPPTQSIEAGRASESQNMQQIELLRWGPENLAITNVARPQPGRGEVLVRMQALSLNFRDLLVVQGQYNPKMPLPLVPVSDGAGVIVERGDGARKFTEGTLVMPIHVPGWTSGRGEPGGAPRGGPNPGVAAEYVVFDERDLVAAPDHLNAAEAATLPCAAVTAWNGLFGVEPVMPGRRVLILGTGGVALFALQFAKMAGAQVAITSSQDEKLERAKAMGADYVVNYHADANWGGTVRELFGGEGADVVIELGGARTLAQSLRAVRRGGTVALIGSVTGPEVEKLSLPPVFMRNVAMRGIAVGSREIFEDMVSAIAFHQARPVIDRNFQGLEEFPEALQYLATGEHFGKITIEFGQ
ncbi:MAG: acyl-CoA synthetase [Parvibaculaceae bacterium]